MAGSALTHVPVAAEWRMAGGTREGRCFRSPGDRSRERPTGGSALGGWGGGSGDGGQKRQVTSGQ